MHFDLQEVIAEGSKVVCVGVMTGTHDGPLHGIPATDWPTAARQIHVLTFSDTGMITEHLAVRDDVTLLRQLARCPQPRRATPGQHPESAGQAADSRRHARRSQQHGQQDRRRRGGGRPVRGSTDRHAPGARRALGAAAGAIWVPDDVRVRASIKPAGVARLRRWKLLDTVLATELPPARRPGAMARRPASARPGARTSGAAPIAPRRTVLDPILLTAAARAGVEVEMGVSRCTACYAGASASPGSRRRRESGARAW